MTYPNYILRLNFKFNDVPSSIWGGIYSGWLVQPHRKEVEYFYNLDQARKVKKALKKLILVSLDVLPQDFKITIIRRTRRKS